MDNLTGVLLKKEKENIKSLVWCWTKRALHSTLV